ncbi:hypothetical protein CLAIMM_14980 [Cladophialophora immunda]|nr:hypothetical protein CLAIMM_14980 [Cladophialophora immunda]
MTAEKQAAEKFLIAPKDLENPALSIVVKDLRRAPRQWIKRTAGDDRRIHSKANFFHDDPESPTEYLHDIQVQDLPWGNR